MLVVEDDRDIREAVAAMLEAEGYVVLTAGNGDEALKVLAKGLPCVVLLDLMMPVMNGWDFMKAMGEDKRLEDIPVVVCSAYSERPAKGVRRVLKKPLDVNKILAAVAEYCCCPPMPAHVQH